MNAPRGALLNKLLRELPDNYVVDTAWLVGLGLSATSIRDYVQRGWLERVAPRLYRRGPAEADTPIPWQLAVLSIQNLLKAPLHVGGLTALELAGYWQYAIFGRRRLWLYSDDRRVRTTLANLPLDADAETRSLRLFSDPVLGVETRAIDLVTSNLGPAASDLDLSSPVARHQSLRVSSLERAIIEVLDRVPGEVSFEHGGELFEGLTTLRPRLAVDLLQACRSVKAKRLFLYFATQQKYSWVRFVRRAEIDLGSGKRQIVAGGMFDPDYQITVPRPRGPARPRSRR